MGWFTVRGEERRTPPFNGMEHTLNFFLLDRQEEQTIYTIPLLFSAWYFIIFLF